MKNRYLFGLFLTLLGSLAHSPAELATIDFKNGELCAKKVIAGYIQIQNSRGTICISTGSNSNSVSSGSRFSNDVEGLAAIHREGRASKIEVSLADVQNLGYDVTSIRPSAAYMGTLLFAGYNFSGSDSYHLFTLNSGVISPVVTPSTDLPLASTGTAKPWHFPDHETIGPGGIVFDTSTTNSTQDTVVFELPAGSALFRKLPSEGDDTGFGIMTRLILHPASRK